MAIKTFAVIGLGRFGESVVDELVAQNHDVLVMDKNPDRIQKISKKATHAVVVNSTDKEALRETGIKDIDHVIVAIGHDIQSSILTTVILQDLDVKKITVKVQNEYHQTVINKLGVLDTVFPEFITGKNLANRLATGPKILENFEIGFDYSFFSVKMCASEMASETGRVNALALRQKIRGNAKETLELIAIKQDQTVYTPKEDLFIQEDAELWLIGSLDDMAHFTKHWCDKSSKDDK